jgi:hypothetical protein
MGSKIKDVGKVKEIPFGPQLPTNWSLQAQKTLAIMDRWR